LLPRSSFAEVVAKLMNEPLTCWIVGCLLGLGRFVMFFKALDKKTETYWVQWYFWAGLAMLVGCLHAFYNLVVYDLFGERCFFKDDLQKKVPKEYLALNDANSVAFPTWLKLVDIAGTLFGFSGFIGLLLPHVYYYVIDRKNEALAEVAASREASSPIDMNSEVTIRATQYRGRVTMIHEDSFKVTFTDQDECTKADWFERRHLDKYVETSNPFSLNKSAELSLLVILTPGVFIVLALFAKIRMIEVFLGTTFDAPRETWAQYTTWRKCTAVMDLECASAFQFITVLAFAALCASFFGLDDLEYQVEKREKDLIIDNNKLRHRLKEEGVPIESKLISELSVANAEHTFALQWAGLQGIGFYILVGMLRSLFNILGAGFVELGMTGVEGKWLAFLAYFQPVFVFTTIICIYNWSILQKLRDIKREVALGPDATYKFIAVRALLLVSDGQKSFLQFGTKNAVLTMHQADLLNVNLLIFECCLVIIVNRHFWKKRVYGKKDKDYISKSGLSYMSLD